MNFVTHKNKQILQDVVKNKFRELKLETEGRGFESQICLKLKDIFDCRRELSFSNFFFISHQTFNFFQPFHNSLTHPHQHYPTFSHHLHPLNTAATSFSCAFPNCFILSDTRYLSF
jgi:hypothetical protein